MRCTRCSREMKGMALTFTANFQTGRTYVCNLCKECGEELVGKTALRRLTTLLATDGWVQQELSATP